jgi:hypothetical protein
VSVTNVYGPIVTRRQVGVELRDHIFAFFPGYLRDVQRQTGWAVDVDADPDLWAPPYIHSQFSWDADQVVKMAENDLPALILGCPGILGEPQHHGEDSAVEGAFVFGLHSLVSGMDADWTDRLMGEYVAALWALCDQQPEVSANVGSIQVVDVGYDALGQVASRTLAAGTVTVRVVVEEVLHAAKGPLAPPDDPNVDPGGDPEVLTTELTVDRLEV